ncbi:hypothetical protein E2562_033017 [Oryza meyeriana var. granulata]|uniref:Uncharacterized protein n=1 Tax=Oryza meyeriana var. granulata TaxID=110450 RepID=A0A6G1CUV7_9ORYZ|nr:hypothetical protein E2562_033017 [Oryza meyeriana var. granulata]
MRGTFGNIRIVNKLLGGKVGPKTIHIPTGEKLFVYDAAMVELAYFGHGGILHYAIRKLISSAH